MLKKFAAVAVNLVFFALVMAIAAYWGVRVFTPAPTAAPPPIAPPPLRDPDPVAVARMFGKVERVQAATSNIQAIGAYSAGKDSSAVLSVDGRPARVFLLGQEVAPGLKLAEVGPETVVLESGGGARQELRLPPRAMAAFGGAPPPPNFTFQGNMLTAPTAGAPPGGRPAGAPGQLPQPQPPPPAMPAPPPGAPPAQTQ
jgi:general secretion pathway protein C